MHDHTLLTRKEHTVEARDNDVNNGAEDKLFKDEDDIMCDEEYLYSSLSSPTTVSKHSIQIKFKLIRTHALSIILFKNLLPGIAMHLSNIINTELYPENYQVLVYRVQLNLVIMATHAMVFVTSRASPSVYTIIDRVNSISSLLNIAHMLWTWLLFRRKHLYATTNIDFMVTMGLIGLYVTLLVRVIVSAMRARGEFRWNKL